MKVSVLALDYDGTIAVGDHLPATVREAIAAARTRGVVVILVTGRTLGELRRVAGDLHFVDVVVAENGAIVHYPGSGRSSTAAPGLSEPFVTELRRRGIPVVAGLCLIDADANDGARILETIRSQEAPVALIFNRGRVMGVTQGVSKATGLQLALASLRLSARNCVAIGDAENDFELLRLAEVGVAVGWGSRALQAAADVVLTGEGPEAVGRYIRQVTASGVMPDGRRPRRQLLLGHLEDGRAFSLGVRGRNVLIAGDAGSGKSWIAGLLCEQLIEHGYCVCVIDPEGDYLSLEALPGVSVLGGDDRPPRPRDLLRALRYPDRSVVIDLSRCHHDDKLRYIRATLPALNALRRQTGLPHRILLDEAHYYLHDTDADKLLDFDRNGYTVVTYRASRLPQQLLAATEVMLVTCESNPVESQALRATCPGCGEIGAEPWALLGSLKPGQAVALPITEEAGGALTLFTIAPRRTPHVRHREKYVDMPVSPDHGFMFNGNGRPAFRACTLRQFVSALEATPVRELQPYLVRGDFSRWMADVYGDMALAGDLRALEGRYRVGHDPEAAPEIANVIRGRYQLTPGES